MCMVGVCMTKVNSNFTQQPPSMVKSLKIRILLSDLCEFMHARFFDKSLLNALELIALSYYLPESYQHAVADRSAC